MMNKTREGYSRESRVVAVHAYMDPERVCYLDNSMFIVFRVLALVLPPRLALSANSQ